MNSSALRSRTPVRIGRGLAEAAVERARLTVVPRGGGPGPRGCRS